MTRLGCHRFQANGVRLWLSLLAYNLGNPWRRLALPGRIGNWSLTSLQPRLVKTGGRLIKHARYYWLLLAESHLTRRLFRRDAAENHRAAVAGGITRAVVASRSHESRWFDGRGVSKNRPGRGRIAVLLHPKWPNGRFRLRTVACAGAKHSTPCGTRSGGAMRVLKQKVIMEIPAETSRGFRLPIGKWDEGHRMALALLR